MSPTLEDGDYIIIIKARRLRAGLIYVINHSDLGQIVKRLDQINPNGSLNFRGDNPASTPAALMSHITPERITGRALIRITKNGLSLLGRLKDSR